MLPEARGIFPLKVYILGDVFCQVVVCKFACLFEAIHPFPDFCIDAPIVFQRSQPVLLENRLWDKFDWYAHIFISFHWSTQVEFFMSQHMNFSPLVDMPLLDSNLSVMIYAVYVVTSTV